MINIHRTAKIIWRIKIIRIAGTKFTKRNCLSYKFRQRVEINSVILPKNTRVPAEIKQQYRTTVPYQESLDIQVTQGEDKDLRYVTIIGTTTIEIEPRPKIVDIEVSISCDENSIIHVRVFDLDLQRDLGEMMIDRVSNLSEEEIERNRGRISSLDISGD